METFDQRLKRYVTRSDREIFGWLSVMFQNCYLPEIRRARENELYLCVYLTTHSVIQMVSENMFD